MSTPTSALDTFRAEIQAELRACLSEDGGAPGLYDMLRYHLGWLDASLRPVDGSTGKLLRPTLCLLAAQAVHADHHVALPAAAALELLHNFSLIHDDIQDRSDERHHRPTVWKLWGDAQAIDVGDAALALAGLALARAVDRGVYPEVVVAGTLALNLACLRLAEGQHLDISFEGKLDVSADEYYRMISGKTAALLACSLELGALFGSGDPAIARSYWRVGHELGLAFQIQDDVLGIWGEEARTGKPAASDLAQRKMTLPVIHALAHCDERERSELARIYGQGERPDEDDVARALAVLERSGAKARAESLARQHYARAVGELRALRPMASAGAALEALASFLVSRDY